MRRGTRLRYLFFGVSSYRFQNPFQLWLGSGEIATLIGASKALGVGGLEEFARLSDGLVGYVFLF
jgi:hypothetical protein